MLHAIAGPVDANTMLREAHWVIDTWNLCQLELKGTPLQQHQQQKKFFSNAHMDRLSKEHHWDALKTMRLPASYSPENFAKWAFEGYSKQSLAFLTLNNPAKVHVLLAVHPVWEIKDLYKVVFENILNEKISTTPVVEK